MLKRINVVVFSTLFSALLCRGAEAVLGFNLNSPEPGILTGAGAGTRPAWAASTNKNIAVGAAEVVLSTTTADLGAALSEARLLAEERAVYLWLLQNGLMGGGKK